jgi:hypothetical protein
MLSTLIYQHTEGLKAVRFKDFVVLIAIYILSFAIILYLNDLLVQYNILHISILYTVLLIPVVWSGWLVRKSVYFPAQVKWMIPLATSSYFIMDDIEIFYNVRYGHNLDILISSYDHCMLSF